MSSGATESTEEFGFVTRTPDQQLVEALGSPVEVGSCVHISDQQTLEDEDTTQDLDAINSSARVYTEHAVQAQELPRGVTSSLPVPDGQASEGQESTQEFTVPPHGLELDDALQGSITSASTDIPDRQAVRVDETTQALTASTIIYVPEDEATTSIGEATTQERTASTVIQIPDRQALGYDETTQEFTALRHVLDRQATEEGETTQEHTASTVQRVSDRGAIGDEETTQGLTAFKRNVDVPGASLESSASSPTHSSVRNVSGIQETAQEVSITTSFAARLPDRQVVEADALTPPPPLTITTQPSTALTHVTDTQAVDAHRGDSQPRLATPASHAALGQEVAAASSPPEAQTNPQGIETVQKDDERKATPSDLGEEITRLSMTVPSARLTIAYNRGFISDDEDLSKDVIRHLRTAGGWDLISVIQDADRADFILNLSYYTRPVEEAAGRFIPFSLSLQLIFQPASDNCVLFNHGGGTFYLEHLDAASTRTRGSIESMQCRVLRPGIWRISMRGEKPRENVFHSLVQWLILPRKFGASIDGESTKRQKLSETSLVRKHQETMILIKNLEDGQSARIWGVPGDTADYELQRIKHIASTSSARVFACRHSKVAGILAVKVIDYDAEAVNRFDRRSAAHLAALVAAFKRETSILQRLDNNHIVSLKAFDGRFLALFLEQLPPSLDRGDTIKLDPSIVRSIVHNISSALYYLEKKGIVHHDLKPHNIAHSPARGAVLLDFGQAAPATTSQEYGGTLAFLPPEFPHHRARGHAGDVWALGLTTLYLLGKIPMPRIRLDVRIRDLYRYGSPPQFDDFMGAIALQRKGLNLEDEIEKLAFRMLDPKPEARATARGIVSALGKTLLTA